jgi:hypothetical protein
MDTIKNIAEAVDRVYNSGKFHAALRGLEKMHDSPFSLFTALSCFSRNRSGGFHEKHEWKDIAGMILLFVSHNFPERTGYTVDCLRWDWFISSGGRRYPSIIAGDAISNGKKRLASLLQEKSFREKLLKSGVQISARDLKNAEFFTAETIEFREEYTEGNMYVLNIPGRKMLFIAGH